MYKWLMFGLAVCGGCGGSNYQFEDEQSLVVRYPLPDSGESVEAESHEVLVSETSATDAVDVGGSGDAGSIDSGRSGSEDGGWSDVGTDTLITADTNKLCGPCLFKASTLPLGADADSSKSGFGCCSGSANYTGPGKFTCIIPDCSGVSGKCAWWCGDHVCPDANPCPGTSGD